MVHNIYIGAGRQRGRRAYVVVHQSTEWKNISVSYSVGLIFAELVGYLVGASVATLGDIEVVNGIPEPLARKLKISQMGRLKESRLQELLKSADLK